MQVPCLLREYNSEKVIANIGDMHSTCLDAWQQPDKNEEEPEMPGMRACKEAVLYKRKQAEAGSEGIIMK